MTNAPWGDLNYPWRLVVRLQGGQSWWRWFQNETDARNHIRNFHYNNGEFTLTDEREVIHLMEVSV